ncbi:MAG: hypothetical protein IPM27_12335 [Nitrosomonadales bacterium]|nr:hypothetical protein [Nitrosomonadales bacterium]
MLESAQYSGMELNGNGVSQKTVIGFGGEIYVEGIAAGSYQAYLQRAARLPFHTDGAGIQGISSTTSARWCATSVRGLKRKP